MENPVPQISKSPGQSTETTAWVKRGTWLSVTVTRAQPFRRKQATGGGTTYILKSGSENKLCIESDLGDSAMINYEVFLLSNRHHVRGQVFSEL